MTSQQRRGDELQDRLLSFAARIGKVVDALPDTRMGRHIAGRLVRCGTAAAPNYAEGRGAESRRDFVHKLSICLKELRETDCWLQLVLRAELLSVKNLSQLIDECGQLMRIIAKSIVTAKANNVAKETR